MNRFPARWGQRGKPLYHRAASCLETIFSHCLPTNSIHALTYHLRLNRHYQLLCSHMLDESKYPLLSAIPPTLLPLDLILEVLALCLLSCWRSVIRVDALLALVFWDGCIVAVNSFLTLIFWYGVIRVDTLDAG